MKKSIILLLVSMFLTQLTSAYSSDELPLANQLKSEIEAYYVEVLGKMAYQISLIDIVSSEDNSNVFYVYFLDDKSILSAKDFNNNIYSRTVRVMIAVYTYSYLIETWRLKTIRRAGDGLVFKVKDF